MGDRRLPRTSSRRNRHDAVLVERDLLGKHAIDGGAQARPGRWPSGGAPSGRRCRRHGRRRRVRATPSPTAMTSPAPSESGITARPLRPRVIAADDRLVAKIERRGAHADDHLARHAAADRAVRQAAGRRRLQTPSEFGRLGSNDGPLRSSGRSVRFHHMMTPVTNITAGTRPASAQTRAQWLVVPPAPEMQPRQPHQHDVAAGARRTRRSDRRTCRPDR